jgi:hypothetical protein
LSSAHSIIPSSHSPYFIHGFSLCVLGYSAESRRSVAAAILRAPRGSDRRRHASLPWNAATKCCVGDRGTVPYVATCTRSTGVVAAAYRGRWRRRVDVRGCAMRGVNAGRVAGCRDACRRCQRRLRTRPVSCASAARSMTRPRHARPGMTREFCVPDAIVMLRPHDSAARHDHAGARAHESGMCRCSWLGRRTGRAPRGAPHGSLDAARSVRVSTLRPAVDSTIASRSPVLPLEQSRMQGGKNG